MLFSTFVGVSLTSKRIVSNVGKSHITVEKVKEFLALNPPGHIEVFVGQLEREKTAGMPFTHHSFVCVLISIPRLSVGGKLCSRNGEDAEETVATMCS